MSTRPLVWKTGTSGTEGTTTVFVDSYVGNDYLGNGTRANPYRTLTKAWNAQNTKPTKIVCRGLFSEQMTLGNHACEIAGDYWGAAIFDGQNKYLLYGYGHSNLIILNANTSGDAPVATGATALQGVGRANHASYVGITSDAGNAYGVAGSAVFIGKSGLYWGIIGGNTAVNQVVYWKPQHNDTYKLSIGCGNTPCLSRGTVYDVTVEHVRKTPFTAHSGQIQTTVFGKCAIILNNPGKMTYRRCLFASDVKFYYFVGTDNKSEVIEIVPTGNSDADKAESLINKLTEIYAEKGVQEANQYFPSFVSCIFSSQSSEEIFNDPENGDMTLVPGCDADIEADMEYLGALPPCMRIPIKKDSTGLVGTWDERSADGCVKVSENNIIYIDEDSPSATGGIMSKIIEINPTKVQFNGIFSLIESKWHQKASVYNYNDGETAFGQTYTSTSGVLPAGIYMVSQGSVSIKGYQFDEGEAFSVVDEDNFTIEGTGVCVNVVEPNAGEVIYCRCRSSIYKKVKPTDTLTKGGTYLNIGNKDVTYHGRKIVPGESFICTNELYFTADSNNYEIGVMFDADGAPESAWIPARFWGDYYVGKKDGVIDSDEYGVPYSSGNNRSFTKSTINKSVLDRRYVQFKIMVKRY